MKGSILMVSVSAGVHTQCATGSVCYCPKQQQGRVWVGVVD
jgi:hypothetical protein